MNVAVPILKLLSIVTCYRSIIVHFVLVVTIFWQNWQNIFWSNERDLNPRFSGFAIPCIGPLCHRCMFGRTWQVRTADLFRVKEAFYRWINVPTILAPLERFELPTNWLTANCSTTELQGNKLAVSEGFEPSGHLSAPRSLANCWFKPLIQLTKLTSSPLVLFVSKLLMGP